MRSPVQMTVRFLSATEKLNVMVFYLMLCTLFFSVVGCLFTWQSLITPVSATHVTLLVSQGLFGYGNQVRQLLCSASAVVATGRVHLAFAALVHRMTVRLCQATALHSSRMCTATCDECQQDCVRCRCALRKAYLTAAQHL